MTPPILRCACVLLAAASLQAQSTPVRLWPGAAPGEKVAMVETQDSSTAKEQMTGGRPVARISNVSEPTLTLYRPAADKNTGAAVLVCPGGGYYILANDLEGTEICQWLNSIGVTGVLLKYRVPRREGLAPYAAPLQDAQRALGMVRANAKQWGIDPKRIGAMGFSAGGNLCAVLSANSASRTYPRVDPSDDVDCRPNFQLLIYPAYLVGDGDLTQLRPEVAVTAASPETFLVMAEDDPIHVENVFVYAAALKAAKVPMELHVYPTGGHGYGLRPTANRVTSWPDRAADWLRSRGFLKGD